MQVYRARNPKKSPLWQIPNRTTTSSRRLIRSVRGQGRPGRPGPVHLAQSLSVENDAGVPDDIVIYRSGSMQDQPQLRVFTATDFLAAITHISRTRRTERPLLRLVQQQDARRPPPGLRRSWFARPASHRRPAESALQALADLILRVWHVGCSSPRRFGAGLCLARLFVPGPPQNRATSRALPGRSPDASQPPLGVTPKLTEGRQILSVATSASLTGSGCNEWQRRPILPHPRSVSTSGRARTKFLTVGNWSG